MSFLKLHFLFLFSIVILSAGCYEEQEGCLDFEATNFDVDADNPCPDCCRYPQLSLAILNKPLASDTMRSFKLGSIYQLPHDTTLLLKVKKAWIYLSDIQLIKTGGDVVDVSDTVSLDYVLSRGDTVSKTITDNFAFLLTSSLSDKSIGEIRTFGSFEGIQFRVGLKDESREYVPSSLPNGHPLNFQADSLNWTEEDGYAYQYWEFYRDTADIDSTVIRITAPYSDFIQLYQGFEIRKGFNIKLTLRINYLELWRDIDPKNMTVEEIRDRLVSNLQNAFSLDKITN
ncbi:MAG: hypothetical protein KDC24_02080 [Saprospiraceae bacterium]|nr:hypothetical protein [Saprospiraceae bacterium]